MPFAALAVLTDWNSSPPTPLQLKAGQVGRVLRGLSRLDTRYWKIGGRKMCVWVWKLLYYRHLEPKTKVEKQNTEHGRWRPGVEPV